MNAAPTRNQADSSWRAKAFFYSFSAAVTAAAFGMFLGLVGSQIPIVARATVGSMVAVVAVVLGALDVGRRHLPVVEWNRETPKSWMRLGPIRWATLNGAVLGIGATSRIGFWLWYAIPLGALLCGDLAAGALIYGTYGLVRGSLVWLLILADPRWRRDEDLDVWLLHQYPRARTQAAAMQIALGVFVAVVVGL